MAELMSEITEIYLNKYSDELHEELMKMERDNDQNKHAFDAQIKKQVSWIDKNLEAKGKMFNQEQEMFYRATDYRGS